MNKKIGIIIGSIIGILVVISCTIIMIVVNKANKELDKEKEKLDTLIINTKSGVAIETNYTHIEDSEFYIKVPVTFKPLDYDTLIKKYNNDIPSVVFSNDETTVNLVISLTENEMSESQIKSYKLSMEKILRETGKIIDTDYYQIDNHNIGSIRVITEATDTEIYNHMMFFSYEGKLVIVSFNCTIDLKDEWENVGNFLLSSLFFKEK